MKKISLIIAIVIILSSLSTSVMGYGLKFDNESSENGSIACVDFLDFSVENNNWAQQNEDGEWVPNFDTDNAWDEDNDWYPSQASLSTNKTYGYSKYTEGKLDWSLIDNGEVLHLESISSSVAPGMCFNLDSDHFTIKSGREKDGLMEYCKIRIRNYSTSNQVSFGMASYLGSGPVFLINRVTDVAIQNNSSEWITYTFSLLDCNIATNYKNLLRRDSEGNLIPIWKGYLGEVLFFPFGYNKENATGAYEGATMDIDYIVFGSKAYVESYTSKLEEKEKNASSIKIINEPKQKTYYVGDTINLEGLGLEVTYKDGTKEIIESANVDYSFDKATKDSVVTLKYGEASTTYKVEVIGITGMEIEEKPENPTYEVAKIKKDFAPKDIKMRVSYADGTSSIIGLDKAKIVYDFDIQELGEHDVTIEYYGYKCPLKVNIINVVDIKVESRRELEFGNDDYYFVYTCVYSDGSEKELYDADIHEELDLECDTKVIGQTKAKIRVTNPEYGIDCTTIANVTIAEPEALLVSCSKTKYSVGEELDTSCLKVEYKYENHKIELDREYYTVEYDFTKPGTQIVTIKDVFCGKSYQFIAYVQGEYTPQTIEETTLETIETTVEPNIPSNNSIKVFLIITISVLVCAGIVVVIILLKRKSKRY